jgi:hypothetical protein
MCIKKLNENDIRCHFRKYILSATSTTQHVIKFKNEEKEKSKIKTTVKHNFALKFFKIKRWIQKKYHVTYFTKL